jgi:IS1 family transposase
MIDPPEGDTMEVDELCVQLTPSLWLWIGVSRLVGHLIGFALEDRSQSSLAWMWGDVPPAWQHVPVCTDHYGVYGSFFAGHPHEACDKGSGKTSIVEAMNTKWRQRQSGLVRRSCGVCERIRDDIIERFMILGERHNIERIQQWQKNQSTIQIRP